MKSRVSNPNDARAVRSRDSLGIALLRLVERKPFEQVSIRDITTEAGVSYPTFFRQFSSKEELLTQIAEAEIRQLFELSMPYFKEGQTEKSLRALCEYIDGHRSLWKNLLTAGASSAMREEFIRIAGEVEADTRLSGTRANPWLPVDLAAPFVASGVFEILSWWLRQPGRYPIENMIALLDVLVVQPTLEPHNVVLT